MKKMTEQEARKLAVIPLTYWKFAIVDEEDFASVSKLKWQAHSSDHGKTFYTRSTVRLSDGRRTSIYLHRCVLMLPLCPQTDHKNRNPLDNRKDNIRPSNHSLNQGNRGLDRDIKTSRFKGVCWNMKDQRWIASIRSRGVRIYLGSFVSQVSAARAYDTASVKHFGEFAKTNFPRMECQ